MNTTGTKANFTAAIEAARQIQIAEADLDSRKAELLAQIEPIQQRSLRLWRMPCTKQEILSHVLADIDAQASRFLQSADWPEVFKSYAHPDVPRPPNQGQLNLQPASWQSHQTALSLQDIEARVRWQVKPLFGAPGGSDLDWARTCFFFGDTIKAKVEQHFSRLCPDLVGLNGCKQELPELTLQQRCEEIESNDESVATLQAQVDEIDAQLEELAHARGVK